MQQIVIPRYGDTHVMEVREAADPEPGPGEVRIRVQAAGVNYADLVARMGMYPDAPKLPMVVGYEVAGVIDAVGEGVDPALEGQAVLAMTRFGGYSSTVCVPAAHVGKRPEGLDATNAAAIPVTGLTAWMALEEFGRVRPGDRVLVHSAGGGVGLSALDLIKWRGGTAIGTASAGKHDFLRERGYDQLIDYRTQDWAEVLEGQEKFDLVLDPLGGDNWSKGLDVLRPGGKLVCYGFSKATRGSRRSVFGALGWALQVPWLKVNPLWLMNHNLGVCGINMGNMWDEGPRISGWLEQLVELWGQGVVRPVVHAQVKFSEAAEAHRMLHDRENIGKVVLIPD